jgi:cell division septum initiation protein DivIVA
LELLVEDSKKFMGFVKLDEDEFFMLVGKIRASLPEDVRRAGKITENTDRIMDSAQSEAVKVLEASQREADILLSNARGEAERLVARASEDAERAIDMARQEAQHMSESAREEAIRLVEEAQARSLSLTDQAEINKNATAQSHEILDQAEAKAHEVIERAMAEAAEIRGGADVYARDILYSLEKSVQEAIDQVENKFGGVIATIQRGRAALEQVSSGGNTAASRGNNLKNSSTTQSGKSNGHR